MKTVFITVKDAIKAGEWYNSSTNPWSSIEEDFEFEYQVELAEDFLKDFYFRKSVSLDANEIWKAVVSHDVTNDGKPATIDYILELINKPFDEKYSYIFAGCLINAIVKYTKQFNK